LASASSDKTVRLWDVADPTRAQQVGPLLTGFTDTTYAVAFDPAGSLLAASGVDGVIHLWNVTDPAHPVRAADPLAAHNDTAVAFSPDGTILASGSYDGTAKLWNLIDPAHPVALGQPLADPRGGLGFGDISPGRSLSGNRHHIAVDTARRPHPHPCRRHQTPRIQRGRHRHGHCVGQRGAAVDQR
jgi:WD40 repeat protein